MSKISVPVQCRMCGEEYYLEVEEKDYLEYTTTPRGSRRHIQDIFPYLTPQERELFISNTCNKCWEAMFGGVQI